MFAISLVYEIIALCFLFLLAGIWSEDNVRFGYVIVPLVGALFWFIGLLPFSYLTTIIPLVVFMGIISFMRAQAKYKWGVFGTGGGILYKIVFFLIMVQLAIGYVNGLGLFAGNMAAEPVNQYTTYNLTTANETFTPSSSGIDIVNAVTFGLNMVWTMFKVLWTMLASIFCIYPTLVTTFGLPENLSLLVQCGIYVIYGLELINMFVKPFKPIEV